MAEYQYAQVHCENCYHTALKRHPGHDFARLYLQRTNDFPDDHDAQAENWWRCAFPGCGRGMGLILISGSPN